MQSAKQDFDQALSEAQKAIALDPNDPEGHIAMAHALAMSGRPKEAVAFVEAAMRLNPQYPSDYLFEKAFAYFGMDELEKTADLLEQALERNSQDLFAAFLRPATYALLGREDETTAVIADLERISPIDTRDLHYYRLWGQYKTSEDDTRIQRGFIKSGMSGPSSGLPK